MRDANWRVFVHAVLVLVLSAGATWSWAGDTSKGTLFVIGGGLKPDNAAIYERLIAAGGGLKDCRIGICGAAGKTKAGIESFTKRLMRYGVPAEQIVPIDIRPENAEVSAYDTTLIDEIRRCSLIYFTGGDQQRITRALLKADGSDTPALTAIREMLQRGGVLAGSSAGAAMQSETMIAVGGLPDEVLDNGMDALDFGLGDVSHRRGLAVTPGLAFFSAGIIDQHFGQRRGRLGRLARATIERKERYGFGVDENTAMIVSPAGEIEVIGAGCVTILDSSAATLSDGPLGCRIEGLRISCLEAGDRFEPKTGKLGVHPDKKLIVPGPDANRGNHLITDIFSSGGIARALISGLAENTSRKQVGIALQYTQSFAHGYRFTFRKTEHSQCWAGRVDDRYCNTVQDIDLSIEPILANLKSPDSVQLSDLPEGPLGKACQALWFRGLLLADERQSLRPAAPLTRAELATLAAHAVHLLPPIEPPPAVADVPEDSLIHDDVCKVLECKLLQLDEQGRFHPDVPVSREEAAKVLCHLHERSGAGKPALEIAQRPRPQDPITRGEAAEAVYQMLGLR
jgi:cyanophycinase